MKMPRTSARRRHQARTGSLYPPDDIFVRIPLALDWLVQISSLTRANQCE
jgi:hypothetical protein